MTTFLSETVCGRWMSPSTISLNVWLMKDQSFGISDELCEWLMVNTPGWRFEDNSDWDRDTWRRLTFAKPEDAVVFRLFWEDEAKAPKWFLENPTDATDFVDNPSLLFDWREDRFGMMVNPR